MGNRQAGFTIIELIVVIALLGILSAVALPRFINVTADAHNAAVEGASAGFSTGIALLKAQTVADGALGAAANVDFDGSGMRVNASGFAVAASGGSDSIAGDDDQCVEIWNGVLQGSGPVVSAGTGDTVDYVAGGALEVCTYTYQNDQSQTIVYDADNGDVDVTLATN